MFNYPLIDARLETAKYLVVEREPGPVPICALNSTQVCPRQIRKYDKDEFIIQEIVEGRLGRVRVVRCSRCMLAL